jgi:methylenetetrahydrofolate reductase (NADPH)
MGQSGELRFACELVSLIRETTQNYFHIAVAAYPEFHPQAKSGPDDVLNLKKKVEAGANIAITQYFYNPDAYFYFLDDCAKSGIYIPIVPGIMPITNFARLIRFSDSCNAEIPRWIRKRLEAYGDDVESIKAFGIEVVYDLCQRLIAGGAPGLHFYTLNQFDASLKLMRMLKISISEKQLETHTQN